MSASTGGVTHVFDHVNQTLLEGVFGLAPSIGHLECVGLVHDRRALWEHRAIKRHRADTSTVTELDEDDEPVEVDRDCGREQYIFRLPGQWGLEDSASTNGGPLRGGKDGGEPTGGSEVGSSLKKADPKHFGGGFTNPEIKSPSWPMPPR